MPTYEYRCPDGHEFELFQKISDKPRAKCPTCGRSAQRLISKGAGFVFKGSGFYITDYGKDGKGPRKPEGEGGGEKAKETKSTGKEAGAKADTSGSQAQATPKGSAPSTSKSTE